MNWYLKVLKNYAQFNGRARRAEYWYFTLFQILIFGALLVLFTVTESMAFYGLYMLYALATLLPGLAVTIRRMHDVDKSGWYCLIPIYSLILALTEGTKGPNKYGPDPKEGMAPAMPS